MAIDIYIRSSDDPNFISDQLEITDMLDMFLAQIENTLLTDKTEVLGEYRFGASLLDFIHSFNYNKMKIKEVVVSQINSYCTLAEVFDYDVEVSFIRGEIRDIAIIDIIIDGTKVLGFVVN